MAGEVSNIEERRTEAGAQDKTSRLRGDSAPWRYSGLYSAGGADNRTGQGSYTALMPQGYGTGAAASMYNMAWAKAVGSEGTTGKAGAFAEEQPAGADGSKPPSKQADEADKEEGELEDGEIEGELLEEDEAKEPEEELGNTASYEGSYEPPFWNYSYSYLPRQATYRNGYVWPGAWRGEVGTESDYRENELRSVEAESERNRVDSRGRRSPSIEGSRARRRKSPSSGGQEGAEDKPMKTARDRLLHAALQLAKGITVKDAQTSLGNVSKDLVRCVHLLKDAGEAAAGIETKEGKDILMLSTCRHLFSALRSTYVAANSAVGRDRGGKQWSTFLKLLDLAYAERHALFTNKQAQEVEGWFKQLQDTPKSRSLSPSRKATSNGKAAQVAALPSPKADARAQQQAPEVVVNKKAAKTPPPKQDTFAERAAAVAAAAQAYAQLNSAGRGVPSGWQSASQPRATLGQWSSPGSQPAISLQHWPQSGVSPITEEAFSDDEKESQPVALSNRSSQPRAFDGGKGPAAWKEDGMSGQYPYSGAARTPPGASHSLNPVGAQQGKSSLFITDDLPEEKLLPPALAHQAPGLVNDRRPTPPAIDRPNGWSPRTSQVINPATISSRTSMLGGDQAGHSYSPRGSHGGLVKRRSRSRSPPKYDNGPSRRHGIGAGDGTDYAVGQRQHKRLKVEVPQQSFTLLKTDADDLPDYLEAVTPPASPEKASNPLLEYERMSPGLDSVREKKPQDQGTVKEADISRTAPVVPDAPKIARAGHVKAESPTRGASVKSQPGDATWQQSARPQEVPNPALPVHNSQSAWPAAATQSAVKANGAVGQAQGLTHLKEDSMVQDGEEGAAMDKGGKRRDPRRAALTGDANAVGQKGLGGGGAGAGKAVVASSSSPTTSPAEESMDVMLGRDFGVATAGGPGLGQNWLALANALTSLPPPTKPDSAEEERLPPPNAEGNSPEREDGSPFNPDTPVRPQADDDSDELRSSSDQDDRPYEVNSPLQLPTEPPDIPPPEASKKKSLELEERMQKEKKQEAVAAPKRQKAPKTATREGGGVTAGGVVDSLLAGLGEKEKAAIKAERDRRLAEQQAMLAKRKLCLVLDLDHTLLNSVMFNELEPEWEGRLRAILAADVERSNGSQRPRELYCFSHMGLWTKLRPGVYHFLEQASKLFELHVYTMGSKSYAAQMTAVLDPKQEYFQGRVISKGDSLEGKNGALVGEAAAASARRKDLDGVLGMESAVLIIDDCAKVWPHHARNLIVAERYMYFPASRRQFGLSGPSLLEMGHDERQDVGMLSSALSVLERVHVKYFEQLKTDEDVDVRDILRLEQLSILAGVRIVFSRVFPVGETKPHMHPLWRMAEQFGATCTTNLDPHVTHVVAVSQGTDKVRWAMNSYRKAVNPGWLEASAILYKRADESQFPVPP